MVSFSAAYQSGPPVIKEGRIGNLEAATCAIGFSASRDPAHRINNPELGGGAAYDIGVYAIELTTYLIDEPVIDVQSMLTRSETGVDKTDSILLRFPSCTANLQATTAATVREELCIYGSEGLSGFLGHTAHTPARFIIARGSP